MKPNGSELLMAVTYVSDARFVTGSDGTKVRRRVSEYIVNVDDSLDLGGIILGAVDPVTPTRKIPALGSSWSLGNDADASIVLKSKSPVSEDDEEQRKWRVTCEYDDELPDPTEDPGGETTPEDLRPEIIPRYVKMRETFEDAPYRGVFDNDKGFLFLGSLEGPVGRVLPITNSARTPVIPAVEDDETHFAPLIRYYRENWDNFLDSFVYSINTEPVTIKWTHKGVVKINRTFGSYELLINDITAEVADFRGVPIYRLSVEVIHNPDTWLHYELDRGRMFIPTDHEPITDLQGNVIVAPAKGLRDEDGATVLDDVLFNGLGHPLPFPIDSDSARYLGWTIKREKDFNLSSIPWELESS